MSKKYHVRERAFLNLHPDMRAYIIAIVEDGREDHLIGDPGEGIEITLKIGDCSDEIQLYFDLETMEERENSLYKIRTLAEVITAFKRAIEMEVEVMNARDCIPRNSRASAAVH